MFNPPSISTSQVRDYYDRNTRRFLRFGGSPDAGVIHRKLWAEGVQNDHEALMHIHHLLAEELQIEGQSDGDILRILDLGCGVGGTALWLAKHFGVEVTGVTVSPRQVREATIRAKEASLETRCRFYEANFMNMRLNDNWQAAYAIESFAHAASTEAFLETAKAHLTQAGHLLLVDDFLLGGPTTQQASARKWIERFRTGWQLPNLSQLSDLQVTANQQGFKFIHATDLTPLIRFPQEPLATFLRLIARLPVSGSYGRSLVGGIALQVCLQAGWVGYHLVHLQKDDNPSIRAAHSLNREE